MTDAQLFYDGSCRLCRWEIRHLAPRLRGKIKLIDISSADFDGFAGVSKATMMDQLHLWDGQRFHLGLDASFYYWRLAGWGWLVKLLSFPGIHYMAKAAYQRWAARRCQGQCTIILKR